MSEMSQASAPSGGDPLEVMPDTGAKDDVLPGPPADLDQVDDRAGGTGDEAPGLVDQGPEAGRLADSTATRDEVDPDDAADSPDDADADNLRTPGASDAESGSDPMPDMAGTSDTDTHPIS
jgi:hypothetical protein